MFSVKLDNDSYFTGVYGKVLDGINPISDGTLVEYLPEDKHNYTCYKLEKLEESFIWNFDEARYIKNKEDEHIKNVRKKRENAFEAIDFFQMVLIYNELSEQEKIDLCQLRLDWLNAPETGIVPESCSWMIEKYKYKSK